MCRTAVVALAGLSLSLAACTSPTTPALGAPAAFALAESDGADSRTLPLHFIRSNECTGEDVEITGTIHLVSQERSDGGVVGHFNYQNVTAVGLTSGLTYRVSAVDHVYLQPPFPSSVNSLRTLQLIGQGSTDNLFVQVLLHITVNANGEITVSIDDLTTRCT